MNDSILQRIAAGDQLAVDDCLNRYGGLVWSLAKRWIANPADAEDLTQEIFVELWQQAGRFDPAVAGEATFVAMIARRRLIDRVRKDSRRPTADAIVSDLVDKSTEKENQAAEWADEIAKAKRCLTRLSNEQQEILHLVVHYGVSHAAISERLSMPLGTVKSYARRGLIQLRDCMKLSADMPAVSNASASFQTLNTNGSR